MKTALLLVSLLFVYSATSQQCLDPNGNPVAWWVMLLFPGSVPGGFGYLDSTSTTPQFQIHSEAPDSPGTPLYNTFTQINDMNLQSIAWNDEHPDGKTSSSKAHSKGVLAYNDVSEIGFFVDHSIPEYPSFNGFTIDPAIDSSQ